MTIPLNETHRFRARFRDGSSGTPIAPDSVTLELTGPDGTIGGTLVNPSTGSYYVDITPTVAGRYRCEITGTTGDVTATKSTTVYAR